MRQNTMKTYYDKKRTEGEQIKVNDLVLVYNPRLKGLKLHPKWEGPCKVLSVCDHLLEIEFRTAVQGILTKWLPRDRLRKIKNETTICEIIEDTNTENQDVTINDDSDESDDESVDNRRHEHPRYGLRRQRVNPNYLVDLF